MAFFDEVGKKISKTSQGVAQKTKNITETMKLNGMISDEEKSIDNAFSMIGKTYYETYGNNPDQVFAQLIVCINDSKAKIASYSEQIKQIKGIVHCQKCGGEVPYNAPFCNSCGSPMTTTTSIIPIANGVSCNECGAVMALEKVFCTNCGNKMEASVSEQLEDNTAVMGEEDNSVTMENVVSSTPDTIKCPSCGKELSVTAMFCSGCGQKVGGTQ